MITLSTLADLQLNQQITRIFSPDEMGHVEVYAPYLQVDWPESRLKLSLVIDALPKVRPKRWPDSCVALFTHLHVHFDSLSTTTENGDSKTLPVVSRFKLLSLSLDANRFAVVTPSMSIHGTGQRPWMDGVEGVGGFMLDDIGRTIGRF